VVLDGETSPTVDVTATEMLAQLARDLDRDGIALFVARDIGQVRDVIRTESTDQVVNNIYPTVDAAVSVAREHPSRG
jgi:MFS superfamily sulfate permease-like transporter